MAAEGPASSDTASATPATMACVGANGILGVRDVEGWKVAFGVFLWGLTDWVSVFDIRLFGGWQAVRVAWLGLAWLWLVNDCMIVRFGSIVLLDFAMRSNTE
jgi:hypothetical protein